jgi:antitoxin YefM
MTAIAYTQFRHKIGEVIDDVIFTGEPITVTRADGKNFVIVPEGEWDSINQTAHLFSSDENARRLRESLEQAKAVKLVERDIG